MAKEKLNINKTPATLFVGVGGIGSDIVVRVAERCQYGETKNIRFVAMDTNANDLRCVRNSKAQIVPIQTSSTQSVLDYLKNDEDAAKNWFPNNTTLFSKTVSEGAGQVRAISRLALNATIRTGEITKLYKTIDNLFLKDGEEGKQALRVVIASSAAGGTGSGIAMSVAMLIREYLHRNYREKSAIIRGFLILPGVMDTVISTETERESLRRNGYATIKEINAFMIKGSGFCGVRKDLERYQDLKIDVPTTTHGDTKLDNLPFDFCFLLDRVDHSQESMQSLEQYKEFAAQSLYEQNIGPMQRNAFSMEDNIIKEFSNGDNLGRNRFGGIGASILRYPYEDIADYIAYSRAMDRIGDGETAGDWIKYDKKYKETMAEFKKKRAMTIGREPKMSEVYCSELDNDDKRFGIDIKSYLSDDVFNISSTVSSNIAKFLMQFKAEVRDSFTKLPDVATLDSQVDILTHRKEYESDESTRNQASDNLCTLRMYEELVKKRANNIANARAKAILYNAPMLSQEVKQYHLESILKTTKGGMHPNAMRYVLYMLKDRVQTEYETVLKNNVKRGEEDLMFYSPSENNDRYDVGGRFSPQVETRLDDVVALEKLNPSVFDKLGGYKKLWDSLNKHFPGYSNTLMEYRDAVLNEAAYGVLVEYLERLNREYERFYASFETKVVGLAREKSDIVEKLRFRKGDNVVNICGEEDYLDRLKEMCPEGSDGLLLPDELNSDIFEAIKKNAECERMAAYDPYGDNVKVDVFDTVLIDYFCESVRKDCNDVINLNIVKAIEVEQRFAAYFEANKFRDADDPVISVAVTEDDKLEYLDAKIKFGNRLSSAGVGCSNFNEPRVVSVCSFNQSLCELRDIDIKKTIETLTLSPVSTDTVSKYEMKFFNALYNVTPDKLSRFKSPEMCDEDNQYEEEAGIYYNAYHEFVKKIGPDTRKCTAISLHIDKRWDSITEMPEISLTAQWDEMIRIHSALIYGVVYGMINKYQMSKHDALKRIYAFEDLDGELSNFIVSNNTECDEFYEVLDSLYRDKAAVSKIYDMVEERCKYDVECNRRYSESSFFKEVDLFKIGDNHKAPTSMFEIPLAYFNSLPRAKLDDNELSVMIDSIIHVIEVEVERYEQEIDRAPLVSSYIENQFKILVANYNDDNCNVNDSLRKNTKLSENRVINMTFRKVSNKLKVLNTYNFNEKIDNLRDLIRE